MSNMFKSLVLHNFPFYSLGFGFGKFSLVNKFRHHFHTICSQKKVLVSENLVSEKKFRFRSRFWSRHIVVTTHQQQDDNIVGQLSSKESLLKSSLYLTLPNQSGTIILRLYVSVVKNQLTRKNSTFLMLITMAGMVVIMVMMMVGT